jgi:hypothetical protein
MNKDERRKDGGEEEFRWDPDWDFMDADEISKIVGEKAKDSSDDSRAEMKDFLDAMSKIASGDEELADKAIEAVRPYFEKAFMQIEEERSSFAGGNILLNFKQYKRFCESVIFAKELKDSGRIKEYEPRLIKGKEPSELIFIFDKLVFEGDEKKKFADMMGDALTFSIRSTSDLEIKTTVRFPNMWLPVTV